MAWSRGFEGVELGITKEDKFIDSNIFISDPNAADLVVKVNCRNRAKKSGVGSAIDFLK